MSNQGIVDADCHILEPPDIWENHLGSKWQDKAPKLVKDVDGGDAWLTAVGGEPDPIGLTATPGMPFDQFRWLGVTYEEARAGCYNGAERLKDMDIDGVGAEILFPPQRTMSHFLGDEDEDFVLAGRRGLQRILVRGVLRAPTRSDSSGSRRSRHSASTSRSIRCARRRRGARRAC